MLDAFLQSDFWVIHIHQNFIAEGRWTYLISGLQNTLIITLFSVILGTLLGALVAMVRVTHDKDPKPSVGLKLVNTLCRFYLTVIRGTPMMLQILIAYFVIFVAFDPGKVIVAIIAFGINSGAYLAEIFRSGIMSIDVGQMEAGRSLGLPYSEVMLRIILPQAIKNVLPAIGNEFITLLKETSIVGYIALRDLTKGADIIRSQTYDPFPPLLAAACIYLAVVLLLSKGVNTLERRLAQSDRG